MKKRKNKKKGREERGGEGEGSKLAAMKKKREGEKDREKDDKRRRAGGGDTAPLLNVLRQPVAHPRHLPLHRLHLPFSARARRARRRTAGPRGAVNVPSGPGPRHAPMGVWLK